MKCAFAGPTRTANRKQKSEPNGGRSGVQTIIQWTGENPDRDGLIEMPARVTRLWEELFSGYGQDPAEILEKTFQEIEGYYQIIAPRDIRFESHCEHHMAPIIGLPWSPISQMAAWSESL